MTHIRPVPQDRRYLVTEDGRVFSTKSGKQLKPGSSSNGYLTVAFWQAGEGRSVSHCVQHLVAAAFLGPRPEGLYVLHTDGNRVNNRAENLRYDTPSENGHDRIRHGRCKFSPAQVREIRQRRGAGETITALGREFGCAHNQISYICSGKQYASVT